MVFRSATDCGVGYRNGDRHFVRSIFKQYAKSERHHLIPNLSRFRKRSSVDDVVSLGSILVGIY